MVHTYTYGQQGEESIKHGTVEHGHVTRMPLMLAHAAHQKNLFLYQNFMIRVMFSQLSTKCLVFVYKVGRGWELSGNGNRGHWHGSRWAVALCLLYRFPFPFR